MGAGIAGLACASALARAGVRVLVLERARGTGGRCATRRVDGQPVDHGLPFLHGRGPAFVGELRALAAAAAASADWPSRVDGSGLACRPAAFEVGSVRLAPHAGVKALAHRLAAGLEVRLGVTVVALSPDEDGRAWAVRLESGETVVARDVVLALPPPAALALLDRSAPAPAALDALRPLLALPQVLPGLAVIARYPEGTPAPDWDTSLPAGAEVLHTVVHDSARRPPGARLTLVLHANPRWSRAHQQEAPESWARSLLAEAAARYGTWAARPDLLQPHAWRQARVAEGTELSQPLLAPLAGGARLGFCGDAFHSLGGVEGAYLSGHALAARLAPEAAEHRPEPLHPTPRRPSWP